MNNIFKNYNNIHNDRPQMNEEGRQEQDLRKLGPMLENIRQDPFAAHHQYLSKWGLTLKNLDLKFEDIKLSTTVLIRNHNLDLKVQNHKLYAQI